MTTEVTAPLHRSFLALVALTLAGQLCAVAYEMAVAARFGTGLHADALAFSLMIVVAGANEISTWISTLFIPNYIEARIRRGAGAARSFFRRSLLALLVGAGGLAVLVGVGAGPLVGALAPALAVAGDGIILLRLFAPLLLLVPLATMLASSLQAHGRFVLAGTRQLWWYGGTLLSLGVLTSRIGVQAVPVGMVTAFALFCTLLTARFVTGLLPPAERGVGAASLRPVAVLLIPLALSSVLNYANVTFERTLAARLPEGSLAALTYAFRLLNFPVNLFVLNATTMLLPVLAGHAARGERAAFADVLEKALRLAVIFTAPLAALAIALAWPAIHVLLERGAFTARSTSLTATALVWYAVSVIGIAGSQILGRAYQALQEVRAMVAQAVAVILLNMGLMATLTTLVGFPGLPIATSLTALILFGVMSRGLRRRLPEFALGSVVRSLARAAVAGAVAAVAGGSACAAAGGLGVVALVSGVAAGVGIYGALLLALSRKDARLAFAFVAPALGLRGRDTT